MNKTRWANIVCDRSLKPYKMIVTDGDQTSEIGVSSSTLKECKKAAMEVYDVRPGNIIVSQVTRPGQ